MLTRISNSIVALHRSAYGRGATHARTIMQDDYVVCFLEDVYTRGERTLIDAGQFALVRAGRVSVQEQHCSDLIAIVEGATGRPVRAVVSQVTADPDMAIEAFVLAPR